MVRLRRHFGIIFALGLAPWVISTSAFAQSNYKIAGVVVNAFSGAFVSGAEVSIAPNPSGQVSQTVLTGDDGRFEFENLTAGKYVLSASRKGFGSQNYQQHESYSTAIAVGAGKQSDQITFRLTPSGTIAGTVLDESGEPLRSASVILFAPGNTGGTKSIYNRVQILTDDEGRYRFQHVSPGKYYVGVEARVWYADDNGVAARRRRIREGLVPRPAHDDALPDIVYPFTFYPRTTNSLGAAPVIVHGGDEQTADINVTAVPAIHLTFSTLGSDPSQIPNVQVMQTLFENSEMPFSQKVEMVRAGVFEIPNLYPGHFKFMVGSTGMSGASVQAGEMDVTGDGELNLPKVLMATVSGELSFENLSVNWEGLLVQFRNLASGQQTPAQVTANGHFEFEAGETMPGTYVVLVTNAGAAITPTMSATGATVRGGVLQIAPGQTVHLTLAAVGQPHQVDGIAMKDGKPAEGMRIILVPTGLERNPDAFRFDQSDSDGTFSLYTVGPGNYTVLALENAWDVDWEKPGALDKYLPGGTVIQVGAGAPKTVEVKVQ